MPAASPRRKKQLLALSLGVKLGILGIFKYLGFFADSFARVLATIELRADVPTLETVLPVGISFYTFPVDGLRHRGVSRPYRAGARSRALLLFVTTSRRSWPGRSSGRPASCHSSSSPAGSPPNSLPQAACSF
ncbi:MAG TPA: hypothetical protein VFM14_00625 [Gemmatimonadales bacterium]|nr:hypothetical protein [Gemmatimonadales bacterium]